MFSLFSISESDDHEAGVRLGYEKAVDLWIYEGLSYWQRYSAMLLAHSIIVAALVAVLTNAQYASGIRLPLLGAALSLIGLVLSFTWYATAARAFAYHNYWIGSARELESRMKGRVVTSRRGEVFASGKPYSLRVGGKTVTRTMPRGAARLSISTQARLVITMFAILYLLTLGLTLHTLGRLWSVA